MEEHKYIYHLIALRKCLILIIIGFTVVFLALIPKANQIYQFIALPVSKFLPVNSRLIATDITSPFFVPIKLCVILAILISLPNTFLQIWQFVSPGLYKHEKKLFALISVFSFVLFIIGIAFCYYMVLPAIFHFINSFKASSITMLTDIDKYLSFVLSLFITFGVAFETPIAIFLLIHFNFLSIQKARQIRPYMLVGVFIVAAIVTPPDIFSQTMLAIPLYLLYELGIFVAIIL